jgi:hypothetical protein
LSQLITPLACILEAPYSNLDWETDYFDWSFSLFFSVPPDKFRKSILKFGTIASFYIFPNLLFIKHRTILPYVLWVADSIVK